MTTFFKILLHHRLLSHWRNKPGTLTADVQKTLERLQFGYWDNGTRVKILKGMRKPVYEARVTRGIRLLFTVARAPAAEPPYEPEVCLLVWDLVVHDDIGRARRMNIEPETGFLDFETVAAFKIDEPPAIPDAAVPAAVTTEKNIRRCLLEGRADPANAVEFSEAIRWYALDPDIIVDNAEWQALIDDPSIEDLELKLSRPQAETVFADGPVLLRGTAGSGKTTVGVYRLARLVAEAPQARVLYVTYSPALLATVEQLFHDLYHARRWPLPENMPEFLTFPDLYNQLTSQPMKSERLLRYAAFEAWYRMLYRRGDAALAWEEIRGIIKGACLEPGRDCLSFDAYEELGRKRAPAFIDERPRLYRVFEQYQEWRRQDKRHDDIDLARRALSAVLRRSQLQYDHVICDEGQDLTELELKLVVALCRDMRGLFFTADPQQIVNPSGFRWAEIRTLLRDRIDKVPDVCGLDRNYRSVESIVTLANAFIHVQRERTGRTDDDVIQETVLRGATPVLVAGSEDAVLQHVRNFGPRCAVITATAERAEELRRQLGSERVFDVASSKGLEFDACVLWRLFDEDLEVWQQLLTTDEPVKEDPVCRRAIHHVYVALTRARRFLGVYESDTAADLWQTPWLRAAIERDQPDALAKFMLVAADPGQWQAEGKYFRDRERWRQAAECYRRGGDETAAIECDARFHRSVEQFAESVKCFEKIGMAGDAAECLVQLGDHARAAKLFADVERWDDVAQSYEACGSYNDAAEAFRRADDVPNYRRCQLRHFDATRNWVEAARIAVKLGDTATAADYYNRAGLPHRAREVSAQAAENDK